MLYDLEVSMRKGPKSLHRKFSLSSNTSINTRAYCSFLAQDPKPQLIVRLKVGASEVTSMTAGPARMVVSLTTPELSEVKKT